MSVEYFVELGGNSEKLMHVRFPTRRREITNYAVLLTVEQEAEIHTVRLYDGATVRTVSMRCIAIHEP
jgi:hypothetical protein